MRALVVAALMAATLAHVGDSAAARRSLTVDDVFPAGLVPRSEQGVCLGSLLTLCWCKHDLLATVLAGSSVPRACCRAAANVDTQCGPFVRAFVDSLLPRQVLLQCAASAGVRPNARAPPRAPSAPVANPGASVGAREPPPEADAYTGARSGPPPSATNVSGGTRRAPPQAHADLPVPNPPPSPAAPPYEKSFYLPPQYPEQRASGGTRTTSPSARRPPLPRAPKAAAGTGASAPAAAAPSGSGSEPPTRQKVATAPPRGARAASPIPESLPYGAGTAI